MRIRLLGWAGLEVEAGGHRLIIDSVLDFGEQMTSLVGEPHTTLLAPSGEVSLALVTHLHADHVDADHIAASLAPDGVLLRPPPAGGSYLDRAGTAAAEAELADLRVASHTVRDWETTTHAGFTVTAVPAVDGFGDPQVSWVVEAEGRRIFHGGDTMFHGHWWSIVSRTGPFDAVFLPVNGALCAWPHRQPASPLPADLDPWQAAVAASILRANVAVPIHYDAIQAPGVYEQVPDPVGAFLDGAAKLGAATTTAAVLDLSAR